MPKTRRRPVSTDKRFRRGTNTADTGPSERWQHSGKVLEFTERAGILAARATEEHVLDVLVLRAVLTVTQREAALRFKLDYQRAGLAQHVTGSYSIMRRNDDFFTERERTDAEEAAYQRWRNAVRELGLAFSETVIATTCHDQLPRKVTLLQAGLEKLAKWYGLDKN